MGNLDSNWITAGATVLYTACTLWIIFEMRKETRQRERPRLNIYIKPREDFGSFIHLVIENNGLNGASDLSFSINPDIDAGFDGKEKLSSLGIIKNGISFLEPQGKRDFMLFSLIGDDFHEKIKIKFTVSACYKDLHGKTYKEDFKVSFAEFEGMTRPQEPPIYKISNSLEKIEKNIGHLTSGVKKLQVITQTKKQKHAEEKERMVKRKK